MAIYALLPAVRNAIRKELNLTKDECRVMAGPKPPPVAGDRFVAVFGSEWAPGDVDLNQGLDEFFGVSVCVSVRSAYLAMDDQAEEAFIKAGRGIESMVRKINAIIHQSYDVMGAANNLLGSDVNKIIEPLRWVGADANVTTVDDSWWNAAESDTIAGLTLQTNFGRCRRVQAKANVR